MGILANIAGLGIAGAIALGIKKGMRKKYGEVPGVMEIHPVQGLSDLVSHLENSLSPAYIEQVRTRLESEHKLVKNEWDWRYYELKRFFILCGILKEAPMFSQRVDDVWHEMLMFTREYQKFARSYLGRELHHEPNISGANNPDLRGFFDWVYSVLFPVHKESRLLYGGFYRHPVHPDVVREFQELSAEELRNKYFSSHEVAQGVISHVIQTMQLQAKKNLDFPKEEMKEKKKQAKLLGNHNERVALFLYYSSNEYKDYNKFAMGSSHSSCSNCFSCSSDHGNCSFGGDGGSCSSCGGGGD
jgi:hypothetical protein